MYSSTSLSAFLLVSLSSLLTHATPTGLSQSLNNALITRDNDWHLVCSNAPTVIAGYPLDPAAAVTGTTLPETGSSQKWLKYLWCTAGTATYTFFNYGGLNPQPEGHHDVYQAYKAGVADVNLIMAKAGKDSNVPDAGWSLKPVNTGVSLFAKSRKGTLTWGILGSSLTGMMNAAANYNNLNAPMLFQINDFNWGEVGIGMAGLIDEKTGKCSIDFTPEGQTPCQLVQTGKIDFN